MVEDLAELTYDLDADGEPVRRQLDRLVIERGAWATVLFLYEDRARDGSGWRPPRVAVWRVRKAHGLWKRHAAFVLASAAETTRAADTLATWAARMSEPDDDAADDVAG